MSSNEFKCAMCGGVFTKGLSDEEAETELHATFPGAKVETCELVCDNCYEKMKPSALTKQYQDWLRSEAK